MRIAICSAGLVSGLSFGSHAADSFPVRPVMVIVPVASGGPNDAETRLYMPKMHALFGQPFVLDFKPGAGSAVGTSFVAKAAPDGHTLLLVTSSSTIYPAFPDFHKTLPFDPVQDFAPVSLMSKKPTILVANPSFAPKDFVEYMSYVRNNPGKVNFGTVGAGSANHMAGAWLHSATRTKVTFVAYKGLGPMMPDLMGGRLDVTSAILSGVLPSIKSGKLRALALTGDRRSRLLPDVPTVVEQGVTDYDTSYWIGFSAPAATPQAVVDSLSEGFSKVAHMPDVAGPLEANGAIMIGSTPAQFRQLMLSEITQWRKVVRDSGITLE